MKEFLFIGLPYAAIATFIFGFWARYKRMPFTVSSLSSQFVEGRVLFWGSVPFHFGLLFVFAGHLIALFLPSVILGWNADPTRLFILEATGVIMSIGLLLGLVRLFHRRITNDRVRVVTTRMDISVEILLIAQVVLGIWTAVGYRWGSSWFAADMTPYLWSIFTFSPDASVVSEMPLVVQLHVIGAWLLLLLIPFSRLGHFMVAPLDYIARPYQQVMWHWNKNTIRDPNTPWSEARPKNN
jgi:nitrate reductase gamma subunit